MLPELAIGDLKASIPIIQGGMGVRVSLCQLAAAVANEGGIGVIATPGIGMLEPDYFSNYPEANIRALEKEIRKTRALTKGIFGVNILVALTNYVDLVKTSIEEGADIIFSGAGLPLSLPKFLQKNSKTKLVPIVSSARAARIIIRYWINKYRYLPDAIVVEGPKAGGHLGFNKENIDNPDYALEKLVLEVIRELKPFIKEYNKHIPVIAAGGIYTGADIYRFLQLGVEGVQMATRFVTTHECDANIRFKEAYINAKQEDIIIIKSPVGMPGRAIRNSFLDKISRGEKRPFACPYHCLITCKLEDSPYCISNALMNAQKGNFKEGFAFCGLNAYLAKEIISVHELIEILKEEYAIASNEKL
jgi:NAD(P)H-dependent flavin oxidoreductase YrpB (nitropropane dioxygenase family)